MTGNATRPCLSNGQWGAPDVSECRTVKQIMLEMRAQELARFVKNRFVNEDRVWAQSSFTPKTIVDIADEQEEITNTTQPLLPNDASSAANTLDYIIE